MTRHAIKSAWLMSFLLSVPGLAAGPSGVDEGWWRRVKYDSTEAPSYQAVNRAQRFIASLRGDGVVVRPEGAGPAGWERVVVDHRP